MFSRLFARLVRWVREARRSRLKRKLHVAEEQISALQNQLMGAFGSPALAPPHQLVVLDQLTSHSEQLREKLGGLK